MRNVSSPTRPKKAGVCTVVRGGVVVADAVTQTALRSAGVHAAA